VTSRASRPSAVNHTKSSNIEVRNQEGLLGNVPARHRLRENVCPNQGHRGVGTGRSSTDLSKNCSLSIRRTISQNTSSLEDRNNYNTLTSDSEGSNTKLRNSWHDNPEV
jgi:hypothetical protein